MARAGSELAGGDPVLKHNDAARLIQDIRRSLERCVSSVDPTADKVAEGIRHVLVLVDHLQSTWCMQARDDQPKDTRPSSAGAAIASDAYQESDQATSCAAEMGKSSSAKRQSSTGQGRSLRPLKARKTRSQYTPTTRDRSESSREINLASTQCAANLNGLKTLPDEIKTWERFLGPELGEDLSVSATKDILNIYYISAQNLQSYTLDDPTFSKLKESVAGLNTELTAANTKLEGLENNLKLSANLFQLSDVSEISGSHTLQMLSKAKDLVKDFKALTWMWAVGEYRSTGSTSKIEQGFHAARPGLNLNNLVIYLCLREAIARHRRKTGEHVEMDPLLMFALSTCQKKVLSNLFTSTRRAAATMLLQKQISEFLEKNFQKLSLALKLNPMAALYLRKMYYTGEVCRTDAQSLGVGPADASESSGHVFSLAGEATVEGATLGECEPGSGAGTALLEASTDRHCASPAGERDQVDKQMRSALSDCEPGLRVELEEGTGQQSAIPREGAQPHTSDNVVRLDETLRRAREVNAERQEEPDQPVEPWKESANRLVFNGFESTLEEEEEETDIDPLEHTVT